ncbi:MAG: phosphotransferase [Candidatus Yanofskybacteria bacterium]|nr:phosphotransferase [Candidatus Yanofskybacteria bacterium]
METKIKQIAGRFNIDEVIGTSRFGNGLINDTYLVQCHKNKFVLQKLHPILKSSVLIDTHYITKQLSDNGLITPLLVKTKNGKLFFKSDKKDCWRMLTYIPGKCYEGGISPKQAFSAGRLVGQFHNILAGSDYKFRHKIKNFHDSETRIDKLKAVLKRFRRNLKYNDLIGPASVVLKNYSGLGDKIESCPNRVIHGDLKINNIRFNFKNDAVCLLDLDTLGRHKVTTDIAAGARTWCNKAEEGDIENAEFDLEVFGSMLNGYLSTAKFITKKEIEAIPETVERVILTLIARFITDAFEEKYFRLNPNQYKNLYQQNKTRALAQLALYNDFMDKKESINKIIKKLCKL